MAARNGPYSKIIAVDLHESRLKIAKEVGATHVVSGLDPDVAARIQELGGADYAVEATGVPKVLESAYRSLRKGGTVAIVGIAPFDKTFQLPISMHMSTGKRIVGVSLGSAYPKTFIPFLIEVSIPESLVRGFRRPLKPSHSQLYLQGRLPIDKLSKQFRIEEIDAAFAAMKDGSVVKPVLVF